MLSASKKKTGVVKGPLSEEHKEKIKVALAAIPDDLTKQNEVVALFEQLKTTRKVADKLGMKETFMVRYYLRKARVSYPKTAVQNLA
jgi:hypothetical protein